jgi:leucyl-tRNA synthetase
MTIYNPQEIEEKWQRLWGEQGLNQTDIMKVTNPFYNLMMFPYPSAEGLHVGNMYAFVVADIFGRFQRMQGNDVFEPIGLDGFGIHSENYAMKVGRHPEEHAVITEKNFYEQLHKIGAMFDWSKTVETYKPEYYRWTQWLFVQMFKAGLAYRNKSLVNWCPSCLTVLSDEQVIGGNCERCKSVVKKKELEQWFFRITAYAEKLLQNLKILDWSENVVNIQRNWIGKSEGMEIDFVLKDRENKQKTIQVFTTRPDTLQGVTFMALAPGYPRLPELITTEKADQIRVIARKWQEDDKEDKEKEGVFTGIYVTNPINGRQLPVWVANYVDAEYGTGAVMGVPAHDERDREFATKYGIDIDSMVPNENIWQLAEKSAWGRRVAKYHLRDWLISRQRYWGPPIPMIYCKACADQGEGERKDMPGWYSVPVEELPVKLPHINDYKPTGDGRGPLANHKEFYETTCPHCQGAAQRETDVSDTFFDSAWYFLRYPSVGVEDKPWDPEITKRWLPVDMYTGGTEHATLHLMYTRFMTMVLKDLGYLDFEEPFRRFFAHGLIIKDGAKMSKSKGNVVVPDEYIKKFGADALRLYLMFMGPASEGGDFRDTGMEGMYRWLKRVWRHFSESEEANWKGGHPEIDREVAKLVLRVTKDIEKRHYNTAIAGMMELFNKAEELHAGLSGQEWEIVVKLLAPFAPFTTEEMWSRMKPGTESVHTQMWPKAVAVEEENQTVVIQVNGKVRGIMEMKVDQAGQQNVVEQEARLMPKVAEAVKTGKYRVVFVPGKVINFVTA